MRHAAAGSLWGCLLALHLTLSTRARAEPFAKPELSAGERARLEAGALVSRPLRFETEQGRYVGGVSYQIVDAQPELVLAALSDVNNWPDALPRTKSARMVSSADGWVRVELLQGSSLVDARYTVVLERASDGETIRFWLDPDLPHDIADVWGFFRVKPAPGGRSLITVGAALDVGGGITRLLFEDKVAGMILRAPTQIRAFVEPRAPALVSGGS